MITDKQEQELLEVKKLLDKVIWEKYGEIALETSLALNNENSFEYTIELRTRSKT